MAATPGRRILFVTWDGGGNVNPLLALGPRLAARGWAVHGYGPPSLADRFGAAGVDYAVRDTDDPWDPTLLAGDVRDQLARIGADAALVDYMQPGAICGAEAAGCPTAVLVHTLHRALLVDGAPGPIAMAASVDGLNAARLAVGLDPVEGFGPLLDRCDRVLVTCPEELDAGAGDVADNVRYVGPQLELLPSLRSSHAPDRRQNAGDRPSVVVSLGTTPMDEQPVLERVLAALADLRVDVVATAGSHLDPAAVAAPPNATVRGYVPHAALLPGARLVVTHAGLGTVLAALAHGVPLLCLPLGREQPDNAAAVERAGAGLVLAPASDPADIREAAEALLDGAAHRQAAEAMRATIAGYEARGESELEAMI
jgi:UDP:flavonoid glycosyltransferase YjiC (YdhE family)